MMARDVLGIPMSTLGKEVAFSNRGRVLDHHRSSVCPDLREALICGQDAVIFSMERETEREEISNKWSGIKRHLDA